MNFFNDMRPFWSKICYTALHFHRTLIYANELLNFSSNLKLSNNRFMYDYSAVLLQVRY